MNSPDPQTAGLHAGSPLLDAKARAMLDRAWRMEALLVWVRIGIVSLNSIVFLVGTAPNAPLYQPAIVVMIAAVLYSAGLLVLRPYERWPIFQRSAFTTFSDSVFILVWVVLTGGAHSEFYLLYYVSVASIAIRYSLRESCIAATVFGASYATLAELTNADHVTLLVPLTIRIAYMWVIALLVGRLAREERSRASENQEIVRLHREVEEARAALAYEALHDALTGLPNRRHFDTWLDRHCVSAEVPGSAEVALIMLDLDHFKEVNDTLGHPAGDRLLREVAQRLRSVVRDGDLVARLGGDEFAIAMAGCTHEQARAATARIGVALVDPLLIEDSWVSFSASLGMAMFPGEANGPAALLRQADVDMYAAKRGRDREEPLRLTA